MEHLNSSQFQILYLNPILIKLTMIIMKNKLQMKIKIKFMKIMIMKILKEMIIIVIVMI
jgi:hypothetical protein